MTLVEDINEKFGIILDWLLSIFEIFIDIIIILTEILKSSKDVSNILVYFIPVILTTIVIVEVLRSLF